MGGSGELVIDLKGIGCPYGSSAALQHIKDAPLGSVLVFVLDDEECFLVLKKVIPLLGQRIIKSEEAGGVYRLYVKKSRSF